MIEGSVGSVNQIDALESAKKEADLEREQQHYTATQTERVGKDTAPTAESDRRRRRRR
jgi:hypothetical protein